MNEYPAAIRWVAWFLRFVAGSVTGVLLGFLFSLRRRSGPWIVPDLLAYYVLGFALIIGALATLLGDRLWLGDASIVEEPSERNPVQKAISWVLLLSGLGLVAFCVYRSI